MNITYEQVNEAGDVCSLLKVYYDQETEKLAEHIRKYGPSEIMANWHAEVLEGYANACRTYETLKEAFYKL